MISVICTKNLCTDHISLSIKQRNDVQQEYVKYVGRVPSEELINNISKQEESAEAYSGPVKPEKLERGHGEN